MVSTNLYTNSRATLLLATQKVRTSITVQYFIARMFTIIKRPSRGPIEKAILFLQQILLG
jgi:hypothetical protein